jgi:leucyl-tRNA synthetase
MGEYKFKDIERKWQEKWEKAKCFKAEEDYGNKRYPKGKFYGLIEFPYPSGAGLHVGHPKSYTAMDIICRKRRMEGYNVLFPIGYDAFGLPTENYAIKTGIRPEVATEKNVAHFEKQLKMLGYSFDWDRKVNTTDPKFYKWTQWMFLQFFNANLAYKGCETINWCEKCKIGIANEELEHGKCERCGSDVVQKQKSQWMLKMQSYADKLLEGLKKVNFPEHIKKQQRDWIGKSIGAELDFKLCCVNCKGKKESRSADCTKPEAFCHFTQEDKAAYKKLTVFTTRPDTAFGATYMVIAPEHPILEDLSSNIKNYSEITEYKEQALKKTELQRTDLAKDKTGVKIKGIEAVNPYNGKLLPIFIADYVMINYGTGAIMAVPAHDERDYEFAKKYNLPIVPVLDGGNIESEAFTGDGKHINSDFLNGLNKKDAINKAVEFAEEKDFGKGAVNYKMRDWVFSRQRYWGEPIPVVYNQGKEEWEGLPESDLPLLLPEIKDYLPTNEGDSPLAKAKNWVHTKSPSDGSEAIRETDTMPQWAGSSWYFLRYCDPHNEEEFAEKRKMDYWLPVDWYMGGMEHVTRHLLYSRFWNRALYDLGKVPLDEPFKKRGWFGLILSEDGTKMSKSKGNVVNPDDVVKEYGADTLRTYIMFMGPFTEAIAWSTNSLVGVYRFLKRVYDQFGKIDKTIEPDQDDLRMINKTVKDVSERIEDIKFNTAVSSMMEFSNYLAKKDKYPYEIMEKFAKILSPFAPHLAEEIWAEHLGKSDFVSLSEWPEYDQSLIAEDKVSIAVQVDGKKRAVIECDKDEDKEAIKEQVLAHPMVQKYIEGVEIVKFIVVPNKIVSIVTK